MITNVCKTGRKLPIALFITGSLTKKNRIYSHEEFESLQNMEKKMFSVYDNHEESESRKLEEGCGIPLQRFLDDTGAGSIDEISIRSIDGFESVVPEMRSRRYFFPGLSEGKEEGKEERSPLISFYKNGQPVKFYPHPTMMFGQQGLNEQNKDYFAKGMRSAVIGGRDRIFWVKGDALACNRYFSADQLFGLVQDDIYEAELLEITDEHGEKRTVPAVKVPERFWTEEIQILDSEAPLRLQGTDGLKEFDRDNLYIFLGDEALKCAGAWDGNVCVEMLEGILAGEQKAAGKSSRLLMGETPKEQSDFFIRVYQPDGESAVYYYSLNELMERFDSLITEDAFEYYNHNMDGGKGGIRKVTGRGWPVVKLLLGLPEISGLEMIEDGSITYRIFTKDTYKEKTAADGDELTAYAFMLAWEQDQRTMTGMEKGDTSKWNDKELHFENINGNTPYRIYCKKTSANPAVYKNACGIEIQII
ncbi:Uncharacterised protein [uncultured Roseburia sp.]|uniref:Uncharacterized protein n=1 Tax=Brotonthovivens ammoniilytica TaxID=2981725 RepID=A0ABT2TI00_9FIRM|nr:hypothetical protein [Brotonthovivens ammoniilytica]MCU6761839.1 hypothetical protein [Brotonthovivens ammoniilytica]SCI48200.1 Uncharacterised protein [uncultured Roseburia sp.]